MALQAFKRRFSLATPWQRAILAPVLSERVLQPNRPAIRVPAGPSDKAGKPPAKTSWPWFHAWKPAGCPPVTYDPPEAWTTEQVGQLIATATALKGDVLPDPLAARPQLRIYG
jgi:hypothetical protein